MEQRFRASGRTQCIRHIVAAGARRAGTAAALLATVGLSAGVLADGAAQPLNLPYYEIPHIPDAAEAYFSPDSRYLIAQTRDPDAVPAPRGGPGTLTWIFSEDGEKSWRVNDRGQDGCSFFFPDGKRVVWTSTRDHMDRPVGDWTDPDNYPKGAEIYVSDLDGSNVRRLTHNDYYEAEVSVSPDGEWIVFGREIDGYQDIWMIRADGSEERRITRGADWPGGAWQPGEPFFLPGGDRIMFRAYPKSGQGQIRMGPMGVFTVRTDGTDLRRHSTNHEAMHWHPYPAPDGRHFIYVTITADNSWHVFLGDLAGGAPRQLTQREGMNILAALSPDGRKMSFGRLPEGRRFGNFRTFIMDVSSLDLGPEHYVPFDPAWGEPFGPSTAPALKDRQ